MLRFFSHHLPAYLSLDVLKVPQYTEQDLMRADTVCLVLGFIITPRLALLFSVEQSMLMMVYSVSTWPYTFTSVTHGAEV